MEYLTIATESTLFKWVILLFFSTLTLFSGDNSVLSSDEIPRLDSSGQKMLEFVYKVCEEVGPRLGGTEEEHQAGQIIYDELNIFCDETVKEKFTCHPRAFLDFIWFTSFFFIAGFLAYFLINPLLSALLVLLALTIYIVQQNLLWEVIDIFFPKQESFHVIGKIKPKGHIPKRLVLLSGHHDSAYEFPLLSKLGEKSVYLIILMVVSFLLTAFLSIIKFLLIRSGSIISDSPNPFEFLRAIQQFSISQIIDLIQFFIFGLGSIALIYVAFNLRSNKIVLGANDNLSAVSVVLECGKFLANNKPIQTEVWLISFAGEEHMRGSKRFVSKHYNELQERQALLFNLEGLSANSFIIVTAEYMFLAKHSSIVVEKIVEAAKKVDSFIKFPFEVGPFPFAGSDAANFSRKKLLATTMFGIPEKGKPLYWHTLNDTPDNLSGPNMAKAAEVVLQFVYDVDRADL